MILLQKFGVNIAPVLASAGIIGLAVGFGAQELVRDFISGFFMILENQIRAGDVAIINGTGGLVEKIEFRTTTVQGPIRCGACFPKREDQYHIKYDERLVCHGF
jgi:moderate conductance mechanosensitive channel